MRKYKAYLFDGDGTVLNTNRLVLASWNQAVTVMLGHTVAERDITKHYGRSFEDCALRIHEEFGKKPLDLSAVREAYWGYYLSHLNEMDGCFKGIPELFGKIKEDGGKTAIVTSCLHDVMVKELDFLQLLPFVDIIVGEEDAAASKPDPQPAQNALRALNMKPSDALFIGDSRNDMACGKRAGTDTCMVGWTEIDTGILTGDEKPDFVIQNALDLAAYAE